MNEWIILWNEDNRIIMLISDVKTQKMLMIFFIYI